MRYRLAPAVQAALAEATRRWPHRDKKADGTIGDAAHASRVSDHNPAADGYVYAFDLTHDPDGGCDAHALVRAAVARRDPRIKYAISQDRIWSADRSGDGWRAYQPSNPSRNRHEHHAHVSVKAGTRNDISPWWAPPTPTRPPAGETVQLYKDGATLVAYSPVGRRRIEDPGEVTFWRRRGQINGDTVDLAQNADVARYVARLPWLEPPR